MKIIWYPAITLDGFIATTDGNSDWVNKQDELLFEKEVEAAGCTIVGRTTFEQYKDVIYPIGKTTTYVVTTHPEAYRSTDTVHYVPADVGKIIKTIERDGFTSAVLSGGGETNGLFASADAIDAAIISIYPCMLGRGIRLFGSHTPTLQLTLVTSTDLGEGVMQNRYTVAKP